MIARIFTLAFLATAVLPAGAALAQEKVAQEKVGVTAAVNPATESIPPGQPQRILLIGKDIAFNERILTAAAGQAQIRFLDESSFSIGANSDVVVDEFVYDPKAGTGRMVASASKGVFRYVGGALSKRDGGVTFKTPSATIGIRGGILIFSIDPVTGVTEAAMLFGDAMTVVADTGEVLRVTRAGFGTTITPGGGTTRPAPLPGDRIRAILNQLEGRPTATAGANEVPTDSRVARSGVPPVNSERVLVAVNNAANAQKPTGDIPIASSPLAGVPATGEPSAGATDQAATIRGIDPDRRRAAFPFGGSSSSAGLPGGSTTGSGGVTPGGGAGGGPGSGGAGPSAGGGTPPPPPPPGNFTGAARRALNSGVAGFSETGPDFTRQVSAGALDATTQSFTATISAGSTQPGGTVSVPIPSGTFDVGGAFVTSSGATTPFGDAGAEGILSLDFNFLSMKLADLTPAGTTARTFLFAGNRPLAGAIPSTSPSLRAYSLSSQGFFLTDLTFLAFTPFRLSAQSNSFLMTAVAGPTSDIGRPSTEGTRSTTLQAGLKLGGRASLGSATSSIVVSTGEFTNGGSNVGLTGFVRGVTRTDSAKAGEVVRGTYSSLPDASGVSLFGGTPFGVTQPNYAAIESNGPVTQTDIGGTTTSSYTPGYVVAPENSRRTTLQLASVGRTSQTLVGFAAGLAETSGSVPVTLIGSNLGTVGTDLTITTNADSNRLSATMSVVDQGGTIEGPVRVLKFGGTVGSSSFGRSSFINDSIFGATELPGGSSIDGQQAAESLYFVSSKSFLVSRDLVTINGEVANGVLDDNANAVLTSGTFKPSTVSYCVCDFVTWGFWGGSVAGSTVPGGREQYALNTWVAGPITNVANVPSTGTATFSGHAIGTVFDTTRNNFLAVGSFRNQFNFGTGSGLVTISDFDGKTFSGTVTRGTGADFNKYFGGMSIAGTPASSGSASGAFYGPVAQETGGSFRVQTDNGSYRAAGVFVGKR